jgi:hypothetical protein
MGKKIGGLYSKTFQLIYFHSSKSTKNALIFLSKLVKLVTGVFFELK